MDEVEDIFDELEDPSTGNAKRHPLHEIDHGPQKTLPCSASSPSISPNWSPQKAPCPENSSEPDGTMLSSPKSSPYSLIHKCDSPAATLLTGGICLYI